MTFPRFATLSWKYVLPMCVIAAPFDLAHAQEGEGAKECMNDDGFIGQDVGKCSDIDECIDLRHDCDESASCKNTRGSFLCVCEHHVFSFLFQVEDGKTETGGRRCFLKPIWIVYMGAVGGLAILCWAKTIIVYLTYTTLNAKEASKSIDYNPVYLDDIYDEFKRKAGVRSGSRKSLARLGSRASLGPTGSNLSLGRRESGASLSSRQPRGQYGGRGSVTGGPGLYRTGSSASLGGGGMLRRTGSTSSGVGGQLGVRRTGSSAAMVAAQYGQQQQYGGGSSGGYDYDYYYGQQGQQQEQQQYGGYDESGYGYDAYAGQEAQQAEDEWYIPEDEWGGEASAEQHGGGTQQIQVQGMLKK